MLHHPLFCRPPPPPSQPAHASEALSTGPPPIPNPILPLPPALAQAAPLAIGVGAMGDDDAEGQLVVPEAAALQV